jgi:hypothetical protein
MAFAAFVQMRSAEGAALNSHGRKAMDQTSNNKSRAPKVRHCNIFPLFPTNSLRYKGDKR